MTLHPRLRTSLRMLFRIILLAGLAYLATTLDWRALARALAKVPRASLGAGALCAFVNLFGKGTSWWAFLGPAHRPPLLALWQIHLRSAASSIVMPLRAGEGLRIYWLAKRYRIPAAHLVAVALAEKLVNLLTLLALVATCALQRGVLLPWLRQADTGRWWAVLGTVGAGLLLASVLRRVMRRTGTSLHAVTERGAVPWLWAGCCAMLGWLGDCVLVWLMAQAVEVPLPLLCSSFVLLAINLGIALPSTPGHLGTMELAAATALTAYGATREEALSFALLYHAVQVVPVLALAGFSVALSRFVGPAIARRATAAPPLSRPPDK